MTRIFLRDEKGRRAALGYNEKLQNDPHFRDHMLFFEYFYGYDGRGLGASHQTGWTGLIAKLLQPRRPETSEETCSRIPANAPVARHHHDVETR